MRSTVLSGAILSFCAVNLAAAQAAPRESLVNLSVGGGMVVLQAVHDGRSESKWDFETGTQYRVSLDRAIGENTYLGASYGIATMPLTYTRLGGFDVNSPACIYSCAAEAQVQTIGATIRVTDDASWHQILEAGLGMSSFKEFSENTAGERLRPLTGDQDMHFTLGYGFGYRPSRRFQASLIADIGFFLHRRSGADETTEALSPMFMARFALRAGL